MSLFTTRRIVVGSAIIAAGVLGVSGVAFAQAGADDRVTPVSTTTSTPTGTPSPTPTHSDDPATHDVGDDHGGDDPATHDVGDDHGGDRGDNSGHDDSDDDSGRGGGDDDSGRGSSDD